MKAPARISAQQNEQIHWPRLAPPSGESGLSAGRSSCSTSISDKLSHYGRLDVFHPRWTRAQRAQTKMLRPARLEEKKRVQVYYEFEAVFPAQRKNFLNAPRLVYALRVFSTAFGVFSLSCAGFVGVFAGAAAVMEPGSGENLISLAGFIIFLAGLSLSNIAGRWEMLLSSKSFFRRARWSVPLWATSLIATTCTVVIFALPPTVISLLVWLLLGRTLGPLFRATGRASWARFTHAWTKGSGLCARIGRCYRSAHCRA